MNVYGRFTRYYGIFVASVGETSVSLAWSLTDREFSIRGRADGEEEDTTYASGILASDYILDGLEPDTTYTMYVCHVVNDKVEISNSLEFTTGNTSFIQIYCNNVTDTTIGVNWDSTIEGFIHSSEWYAMCQSYGIRS